MVAELGVWFKLALESEKADTQTQKDALGMLVNAVKQGGIGQ